MSKVVRSPFSATIAPGILKPGHYTKKIPTCENIIKLEVKKNKSRVKKVVHVENIQMLDGSTYVGEGITIIYNKTEFFIPHGNGSSVLKNNDILLGPWKDGSLDGIGTYIAEDFKYVGDFKKGLLDGIGEMSLTDDIIVSIKGRWTNNHIDGIATIIYTDGSRYIGHVNNFYKHGKGTFICADGTITKGTWFNDKYHGSIHVISNTCEIISEWVHGVRNEICTVKLPNGSVYSGSCDKIYLPHGFGKLQYNNKSYHIGNWVHGEKHGYGFYVLPNGDYYNGHWYQDKKHGNGIYYSKTGSHAIEYCWNNDIITNVLRSYYY